MSLEISQEYIDHLTKELLTESLIETLDAKNTIVREIIKSVMSVKVDENGRPSIYSSDKNRTYLKYLVENMIRDELKSVTEEVMNVRRIEIRKAIQEELNAEATIDRFVDAFFYSVFDNIGSKYKTKIDVNIEKDKDCY